MNVVVVIVTKMPDGTPRKRPVALVGEKTHRLRQHPAGWVLEIEPDELVH